MKDIIIESNDIIKVVCEYYNLRPRKVFSLTRKGFFTKPRQIIQYLHTVHTNLALREIGLISLEYGRKKPHDHASILHAKKAIEDLIETDKGIQSDMIKINEVLSIYKFDRNTLKNNVNKKDDLLPVLLMNQKIKIKELNHEVLKLKYDLDNNSIIEDVKENQLLKYFRKLSEDGKNKALFKVLATLNVEKNMTHQPLRAS